jgi:hypothetical protein
MTDPQLHNARTAIEFLAAQYEPDPMVRGLETDLALPTGPDALLGLLHGLTDVTLALVDDLAQALGISPQQVLATARVGLDDPSP